MKIPIWSWLKKAFGGAGSCHCEPTCAPGGGNGEKKIIIVGSPNVGKSVIFNNLTGVYATVSNYPGTTVGVSRGRARVNGQEYEVMDTPGMYSLLPITEDERAARSILMAEKPDVVLQVGDAKDPERILPLTLELLEAGLPVVLALNMMDDAERAGIYIDTSRLEQELGVPVVATVAVSRRGMDDLRRRLMERGS